MRTLAYLIATSAIGGVLLGYGQSGDPRTLLQQRLNSQFTLTGIAADRSSVVTAGTLLTLKLDNLEMYSSSCPSSPLNTYNSKKGKLSQPFGKGLLRDIGGSMRMAGGATTGDCPKQTYAKTTQLWVTKIEVQNDGVVFGLFSTPGNSIPYYGDLKFPFEKGTIPALDQELAMIAEVLAPQREDTPANSTPSAQTQTPAPEASPEVTAEQNAKEVALSGWYLDPQTNSPQLQLNPDGSFSILGGKGHTVTGRFVVNGDTLLLTYPGAGGSSAFNIRGDNLYAGGTLWWVRKAAAPTSSAPPTAPLKLPSFYVNAQTPADQLQLNADNSFSLREAGQTYHGTFVAKGNTLEINIPDTNTKTTLTTQGNNLTDPSGQTWALREPSAHAASSEGSLRNEDIIKMGKVGIDEGTIIAKIGTSKCQFDTSTDALIQLKRSGVSAAVLKAMVAAGR